MPYERELRFLREVFQKCHVQTSVTDASELLSKIATSHPKEILGKYPIYDNALIQSLHSIKTGTVYKLRDTLGLCFILLLLPLADERSILLIGPYHTEQPSAVQISELGRRNGISSGRQKYFREYLLSFPAIPEDSPLFLMLDRFCELTQTNNQPFSIVDLNKQELPSASPINTPLLSDDLDGVLMDIKAMEMRYAFENELIRAVSLGQLHMENRLLSALSAQTLEQRIPDTLRNAKNYCVIMNTLLRKAAESGGVHPLYLDRVSSSFAQKIEQMSTPSEPATQMRDMFRSYCRLVRKHAVQHLSPTVKKTVLLIDSDLSANLTPGRLAKKQSVSLGYLSTIFKKEIGKTISEYVREKRMRHAAYLLSSTDLQIQDVALHCGMMDVQYFSKCFKREMNKTPKEYREASKAAI